MCVNTILSAAIMSKSIYFIFFLQIQGTGCNCLSILCNDWAILEIFKNMNSGNKHLICTSYKTVLRSAKRAPANVRRLNNIWRHFLLFSRRTFAGARFAERSTVLILRMVCYTRSRSTDRKYYQTCILTNYHYSFSADNCLHKIGFLFCREWKTKRYMVPNFVYKFCPNIVIRTFFSMD